MRKLLTILFLFGVYALHAQYTPNTGAYSYKGLEALKSLQPPTGCGLPVTSINAPDSSRSAFYMDSCNNKYYGFNPKTKTWKRLDSVGAGGSSVTYTLTRTTDSIRLIGSNGDYYAIYAKDSVYIPPASQKLLFDGTFTNAGGANGFDGTAPVGPVHADTVNVYATKNDLRKVVIDTLIDTTNGAYRWSADLIIYGDFTGLEGHQYLIWNTVTGTQYLGHEKQIMKVIGGVNNYFTASNGDLILIGNDTTASTTYTLVPSPGWVKGKVFVNTGSNYLPPATNFDIYTAKQNRLRLGTNGKIWWYINTNGDLYSTKLKGDSNTYSNRDATGKEYLGQFKPSIIYVDSIASLSDSTGFNWFKNGNTYLVKYKTTGGGGSGSIDYVKSGVGTKIDSTGRNYTVNNDTLFMSTRAWRQKGIDSVVSLIPSLTGYVNAIAGENYLSKSGSTITANPVDLSGTNVTSILPVVKGGTGTPTPSLVGGTGVTITGSFPNQTINVTSSGGTITGAGNATNQGVTNTGSVSGSNVIITPSFNFLSFPNLTTQPATPATGFTNYYADSLGRFGHILSNGNRKMSSMRFPGNTLYYFPYKSIATIADSADVALKLNITDTSFINAEIVQLRAGKQNNLTLTTTGTSGAATFNQGTGALNIPNYSTGATTNALTFNNSGTGDASGTTFNGSVARTLSYNSIGANPQLNGTGYIKQSGTTTFYQSIIPVADGGTGTATPSLVAGTNVTITGSFPNQTINSTSAGSSIPPNIGSGFRIYSPQIPGFKTLFAGNNMAIDSTTNTNGLTIKTSANLNLDSLVINAPNLTTTTSTRLRLTNTTPATSGVTIQNSPSLEFNTSGWTGSASALNGYDIYSTSSGSSAYLYFRVNNNGTKTTAMYLNGSMLNAPQIQASSINTTGLSATDVSFSTINSTYNAITGTGVKTALLVNSSYFGQTTAGTTTGVLVKGLIYNQVSSTADNYDFVINRPTPTSLSSGKQIIFSVQDNGTDKFNIDNKGKPIFDATNTATGTTGNQTINKASGTVNIAAGGTSVTVTNSLVTASSLPQAWIRTNDANVISIKSVVASSGSFTVYLTAAPAAEISIGFLVLNN